MREAWRRMSRRAALTRLRLTRHTMRVPERLIVAPTDLRNVDPFFVEELLNGRARQSSSDPSATPSKTAKSNPGKEES